MICGPVEIQLFPALGPAAYGSVLLASEPPASMYMKPTLLGGGPLVIHACAHSIAFVSRHIGSGPGVVGLSGMHVKPFVPLRTTRAVPSLFITMIVAASATGFGAADIALAMMASSAPWARLCVTPIAATETPKSPATANVATVFN